MSNKLNHHFVPQYHLRLFTNGERFVHLASRDGQRWIRQASIKGQCARHKYYGTEEVEDWLGALEADHATAYRQAISVAWDETAKPLPAEQDFALREACLLQRARTPRSARTLAAVMDQMLLHTYREHLNAQPDSPERARQLAAIRDGRATIRDSEHAALMMSLTIAPRAVLIISDLSLVILRNRTTTPFVLGDSPCVFSNHYMREIKDLGVLGFVTPGLQIVLPLDHRTSLLLYDPAVYHLKQAAALCQEITSVADIANLNALQIHAAEQNVYFSDATVEPSLRELLTAQRPLLKADQGRLLVHSGDDVQFEGREKPSGELIHTFEDQLPVTLDLSILTTDPFAHHKRLNQPRNQELARRGQAALGAPDETSPLSMDVLARWIQQRIVVQ